MVEGGFGVEAWAYGAYLLLNRYQGIVICLTIKRHRRSKEHLVEKSLIIAPISLSESFGDEYDRLLSVSAKKAADRLARSLPDFDVIGETGAPLVNHFKDIHRYGYHRDDALSSPIFTSTPQLANLHSTWALREASWWADRQAAIGVPRHASCRIPDNFAITAKTMSQPRYIPPAAG